LPFSQAKVVTLRRVGQARPPQPYRTNFYSDRSRSRIHAMAQARDEHWTGHGLDWIRTIANFVEFGLIPHCK